MSHKIKLILIVFLTILLFGAIYVIRTNNPPPVSYSEKTLRPPPIIGFERVNNTLVVLYIFLNGWNVSDLIWENFGFDLLYSTGSATLPKGTIEEGDKIIDCSGRFRLIWKHNYSYLSGGWWAWDFEEE